MTNEDRRQMLLGVLKETYPSNIFDLVKISESTGMINYDVYIFGERKTMVSMYKVEGKNKLSSPEQWKNGWVTTDILRHLVII